MSKYVLKCTNYIQLWTDFIIYFNIAEFSIQFRRILKIVHYIKFLIQKRKLHILQWRQKKASAKKPNENFDWDSGKLYTKYISYMSYFNNL